MYIKNVAIFYLNKNNSGFVNAIHFIKQLSIFDYFCYFPGEFDLFFLRDYC